MPTKILVRPMTVNKVLIWKYTLTVVGVSLRRVDVWRTSYRHITVESVKTLQRVSRFSIICLCYIFVLIWHVFIDHFGHNIFICTGENIYYSFYSSRMFYTWNLAQNPTIYHLPRWYGILYFHQTIFILVPVKYFIVKRRLHKVI
jgi:hypothetical protein